MSSQMICIFSYLCGRGCCLVAVTIPANLSCQPVVFPLWIMATFKIYLGFEENLQFREKIKKMFSFLNFWGCLNADIEIIRKYRDDYESMEF